IWPSALNWAELGCTGLYWAELEQHRCVSEWGWLERDECGRRSALDVGMSAVRHAGVGSSPAHSVLRRRIDRSGQALVISERRFHEDASGAAGGRQPHCAQDRRDDTDA